VPYVLQSEIEARLPADFLREALDDNNDGEADAGVWDKVAAAVAAEIDGILGQRFQVPFATVPAVVKAAANVLALEMLYARRGTAADANPWTKQASDHRAKLNAIADGEQPLQPGTSRPAPSVSAITEAAKTTSSHGHLPC
jgi:phage gp36-like protein